MTTQEYVIAFSFFAFIMLMTGGIALAVFWRPKKKPAVSAKAPVQKPAAFSGTPAPVPETEAV